MTVFVSEVQSREGKVKATGADYKMTTCTCVDVSPAPAMRLKHTINITLSKEQDHLGSKLRDTKCEVDIYELSENRGDIEARGVFVVNGTAEHKAQAAGGSRA